MVQKDFDQWELYVLEFLQKHHDSAPDGRLLLHTEVEKELESKGIGKRDTLTVVLWLSRHNYIDLVPPETNAKYTGVPEILRIRSETIQILEGEGWLRHKKRERKIDKLQRQVTKLSRDQLKFRGFTFAIAGLIGIAASIIGAVIPILWDRYSPKPLDTIPVRILNYPTIPDSMSNEIIGSPPESLHQKDSTSNH